MIIAIHKKIVVLLLGMLYFFGANSLELPKPGRFDSRVTFVSYNPSQITHLVGYFGYSTHIHFSSSESILQIAMGDPKAWDIVPVNNHIFIKPIAEDAITNMTVITSKHIYNFELDAKWPNEEDDKLNESMVFQINFRYPNDKTYKSGKEKLANKIESNNKLINKYLYDDISSFDKTYPRNWDFWFKGSENIKPDLAFDDGRFTYLKFAKNRDMPAIYTLNEDNSESLVNTHINPKYPDIIVIHKIKKRFILRKGNSVTCIFNKSFDSRGIDIPTGTTSPHVIRTLKEI